MRDGEHTCQGMGIAAVLASVAPGREGGVTSLGSGRAVPDVVDLEPLGPLRGQARIERFERKADG